MKNEKLHPIKSTGYKLPNDYFNAVEESVFSKLKEENIKLQIQSSGFKVPDDYFETFESSILSSNNKRATQVVSLFNWKKVVYISGIAASIILAITLFFNNSNSLKISDIDTASIETYLSNEDLSAYDLAPYFDTAELNSDNFIEINIKASEIEEYLLQNSDIEHLIID